MYLNGFSRILVGFSPSGVSDDDEPNIFTKEEFYRCKPVAFPGKNSSHTRRGSVGEIGEWEAMNWYPAEELLWVLEPEKLFPSGTDDQPTYDGKGWKEESRKALKHPRFLHQRAVAEHYETQIGVIANLCFGENVGCVKVGQQMFSFEAVFAAMSNESLPKSTRTVFVELMVHLYVAVSPHQQLKCPNWIRLYNNLKDDFILGDGSDRALPHAPNAVVKRVRLLKYFTSDYLGMSGDRGHVISDHSEQRFVLALTKMCRCLAEYGFYSDAKQIKNFLCNPLLKALDGRLDTTNEDVVREVSDSTFVSVDGDDDDERDIFGGQHVAGLSATERYRATDVTELPMMVKGEICEVMLQVGRIRLDYRLSKLLHGFHILAERDMANDKTTGDRLDRSAVAVLHREATARFDAAHSGFEHVTAAANGGLPQLAKMNLKRPMNAGMKAGNM
jgi:hypothetical protein